MYIIGILIGLYLQISIVFLLIVLLILALIFWITKIKKTYIIFLIIIFIGAVYIRVIDKNFDFKYSNVSNEVIVEGVIINNLNEKDYKYTFTIEVEKINGSDYYKGTKLLVNLKKNKIDGSLPEFGDNIRLSADFERANTSRNYKGFDYSQYLKSKGIYGILDVNTIQTVKKDKVQGISKILYIIQQNMKKNIKSILNKEEADLCIRHINWKQRRNL